jgi:ParB-like chromosome segregation protein Spo0J
LLRSIEDNGFTQPVIVNMDNVIVDGEHRWRAAQALGMAEIPIVKVDMSDEQMRIATISHNRARGSHDIELEVQVLRDLESLGALNWAQDSLMISDDEITKLLEDIPAPESLADEDFSTAWEPDKLYDQKDDDFLAQSETFTQELDKQHTRSMTQETLNRVREREQKIKAAKTEQDREAAKEDKAFYRLSLVFHGDEAEMVKSVLGKEPAQRIVEMCRAV